MNAVMYPEIISFVAVCSAFGCGSCALGATISRLKVRGATRTARRAAGEIETAQGTRSGLSGSLIRCAATQSRRVALGSSAPLSFATHFSKRMFESGLVRQAGFSDQLTPEGVGEARWRIALFCMAFGACIGCVFSNILMGVLAVLGICVGWQSLPAILKRCKQKRSDELERCLPEMLEVVALGLRSGLSFDRALELYTGRFNAAVARDLASAQRQWTLGLVKRDDALRSVAATYDSSLFARSVENIIRSLRFGTSLAESLEAAALEARASYRARKQEQVAKAPVKMMLPTGALMLPAMLILVLGPVLLELMEGF